MKQYNALHRWLFLDTWLKLNKENIIVCDNILFFVTMIFKLYSVLSPKIFKHFPCEKFSLDQCVCLPDHPQTEVPEVAVFTFGCRLFPKGGIRAVDRTGLEPLCRRRHQDPFNLPVFSTIKKQT